MRILFLSRWYPYPTDNGARIRAFNLLKYLAERHTVDMISFASGPVSEGQVQVMQTVCQRVQAVTYHPFQPTRVKAMMGFFSPRPRSVIDTFQSEFQALVQQWVQENRYDCLIASEIDMIPYALSVLGVPRILEEIEVTTIREQFVKEQNPLRKARHALTWWKLQSYVRQSLPQFAGFTTVSAEELKGVAALVLHYRGKMAVIPNGVDIAAQQQNFGPSQPDTLVYAGAMTYKANFDAVAYFLAEIWPLIRAERPQATFYVTGKLDGVPVEQLPPREGVVLTGYLDDVRPRVAQSWLSVIPLRLGGGTRLKILESLALGTPVVTTSKGMEGLELKAERDLLVADTPKQFAAAVLQLLRDPNLRTALSQRGQLAVNRYDWPKIGAELCEFVAEVAADKTA
jgi:glycosyltransferase involved in cell wall biosynthesis